MDSKIVNNYGAIRNNIYNRNDFTFNRGNLDDF